MVITLAVVFTIGWLTEEHHQAPKTYRPHCILPGGPED